MHDAYAVTPLIKLNAEHQTIESISAYGKNVFVGTKQGHLLIYSIYNDCGKDGIQLSRYNKTFSKKPVMQIAVVPHVDILISLSASSSSDGIISIHDISTINLQPVLQTLEETKGASKFCIDIQKHESLTGGKKMTVMLCVVVKKKLKQYYWKDRSFYHITEDITLDDIPLSVAYCNKILVLGFKLNKYTTINLLKEMKTEHFQIGKRNEPLVTTINRSSFGLEKDSQTVVLEAKTDENGVESLTTNESITWDEPTINLVYDDPYFIGLLNDKIQVRTLEPVLLIQNIILDPNNSTKSKAKFITCVQSGVLYVATTSQIYCLQSTSRMKQIELLLEQKQFKLAMQIVNLLYDSEENKASRLANIKKLYAHTLFEERKFDEAMKEFIELRIDPCEVIQLFPNLLPKSSSSSLTKQQYDPKPELKSSELDNGIPALIKYLLELRPRMLDTTKTKTSQREQLPQIIDTTLLKCYLMTNDAFVSPLLRLNNCHLEESEKTLLEYEKYPELILLYEKKGLHSKALEMLQSQAKLEDSPLFGVQRTIQYLQNLGEDHMDLVLRFSSWILEENPEEGLKIFTEDLEKVEKLPRARILDFLLRKFKNLVIPYLEHVINTWNDTNNTFHNTLIHSYREKVQQSMTSSTNSINSHLRTKLLNFLRQSDHYSLEKVLVQFPHDSLYEERAIVLGKLKKHEQVLSIYVTVLGDIQKAIQYCEQVYQTNPNAKDNDQVYVLLLKFLISTPENWLGGTTPTEPLQPDIDTALNLLEGNANKIPPAWALKLLPDDVPLNKVLYYLKIALSKSLNDRRKAQILRGLLYAENLQVQEQRIYYQSQNVLITENNICPVCKKRFANESAFVRYPSGDIVHLSCQDKYSYDLKDTTIASTSFT